MSGVPWERGGGQVVKTISLPVILLPIIQALASKRQLGPEIARLLWARYGDDDISQEEALITTMENEKLELERQIERTRHDMEIKRGRSNMKEELNRLNDLIREQAPVVNLIKKSEKNGGKVSTSNLKEKELFKVANELISQFGGAEEVLAQYDAWVENRNALMAEFA